MSARPGAAPVRILVVDDDDAMRDLVATALRLQHYEVIEAKSGEELLDDIGRIVGGEGGGQQAISLIICDVRMPGLGGLDILAALRCASWTTPVVLMTAFGTRETHDEARRFGAVALLDKPFPLERLCEIVQQTVAAAC